MTNEPKRPTHRVYIVTKAPGAEKGYWTEIGAAWANSDGRGFNIKLRLIPLDPNAELVVREPKE